MSDAMAENRPHPDHPMILMAIRPSSPEDTERIMQTLRVVREGMLVELGWFASHEPTIVGEMDAVTAMAILDGYVDEDPNEPCIIARKPVREAARRAAAVSLPHGATI